MGLLYSNLVPNLWETEQIIFWLKTADTIFFTNAKANLGYVSFYKSNSFSVRKITFF